MLAVVHLDRGESSQAQAAEMQLVRTPGNLKGGSEALPSIWPINRNMESATVAGEGIQSPSNLLTIGESGPPNPGFSG
jgi:hypothetical protein